MCLGKNFQDCATTETGPLKGVCKIRFDKSNHAFQLTYFVIQSLYELGETIKFPSNPLHFVTSLTKYGPPSKHKKVSTALYKEPVGH